MLTRPSARAKGPPGQAWTPRPKAMCTLALGRSIRNSAGHSNCRGSRLAAPFSSMTGVPAGDVDAGDGRGAAGQPEVRLHRALDPQRLLDEVGDPLRCAPAARPGVRGTRHRYFRPTARSRAVVSWPAAKRKVAVRTTVGHSGVVPSG